MEEIGKTGHDTIVEGIKTFFANAGFTNAVLGLSGGIDSALTAALAVEALGNKNVVGVMLPSVYSSQISETLARKLANNLKMKVLICPISETMDIVEKTVHKHFKFPLDGIPNENAQARLRMVYLMAYANSKNCLLLDTSNRTEFYLGYTTLYGDQAGSLAPIGDLNKIEVYEVSRYINRDKEVIPVEIIDRVPTAELAPGQKDPFDYNIIAPLADYLVERNGMPTEMKDACKFFGVSEAVFRDIKERIMKNEWKRKQSAPIISIRNQKKVGLFIGRFQPFHNGHLDAIKSILTSGKVDELFIGIGSTQCYDEPDNPFPYFERLRMIYSSLGNLESKCKVFLLPDIHDPPNYVAYVVGRIPKFDIVFSGNPDTLNLFRRAGIATDTIRLSPDVSGTRIREMMRTGDNSWRSLVPDGTLNTVLQSLSYCHITQRKTYISYTL